MQTKTARTQKSKAKESASKTNNTADTAAKKKTAQNAAKNTQKNTAANKKEVSAKKESNAKKSASGASAAASKTNKKTAETEKRTRSSAKSKKEVQAVRVTFLGGINEIGKNLTVFEYDVSLIFQVVINAKTNVRYRYFVAVVRADRILYDYMNAFGSRFMYASRDGVIQDNGIHSCLTVIKNT